MAGAGKRWRKGSTTGSLPGEDAHLLLVSLARYSQSEMATDARSSLSWSLSLPLSSCSGRAGSSPYLPADRSSINPPAAPRWMQSAPSRLPITSPFDFSLWSSEQEEEEDLGHQPVLSLLFFRTVHIVWARLPHHSHVAARSKSGSFFV